MNQANKKLMGIKYHSVPELRKLCLIYFGPPQSSPKCESAVESRFTFSDRDQRKSGNLNSPKFTSLIMRNYGVYRHKTLAMSHAWRDPCSEMPSSDRAIKRGSSKETTIKE